MKANTKKFLETVKRWELAESNLDENLDMNGDSLHEYSRRDLKKEIISLEKKMVKFASKINEEEYNLHLGDLCAGSHEEFIEDWGTESFAI